MRFCAVEMTVSCRKRAVAVVFVRSGDGRGASGSGGGAQGAGGAVWKEVENGDDGGGRQQGRHFQTAWPVGGAGKAATRKA